MLSRVTRVAPTITPVMLPMPPRMTMVSTPTDCRKVKVSGLTKVRLAANSTPMAPANEAPTANAPSLSLLALMPMAPGGQLVLADGGPGPADLGVVQPVGDDDDRHHHHAGR